MLKGLKQREKEREREREKEAKTNRETYRQSDRQAGGLQAFITVKQNEAENTRSLNKIKKGLDKIDLDPRQATRTSNGRAAIRHSPC